MRAFSSEVDTGSREENATKQKYRAPFRFNWSCLRGWCSMAVLVICVIVTSPSSAQNTDTLANNMIGQWELSTADRNKTCVITLKSDHIPSGMKLELEKGCGDALPFTRDITAWSIKGLDIVRLQNVKGQPVIDVTEVESGIFEGQRSGEGVYLLQNLAAARALSKSMDQMIGDWSVVHGNDHAICGLTLTNTETIPDNYAVYLKPRCDPVIAGFNPASWRLERGELLLLSTKGEVWRFESDDIARWRRVPDSTDPFILVRQ